MVLWSTSIYTQGLTSCGEGHYIDLSVGYTPTGFGIQNCGCQDVPYCELVHIILQKENSTGQIELLDCPEISLTERWWREQKDLVDIYDALTCEEFPESTTHADRYVIPTSELNPGDTISILVCKTNPSDNNIIELSASPSNECSEFTCTPHVACPVEVLIRTNEACEYIIPDFIDEIILTDTCLSPPVDVTSEYVLMQIPSAGTVIDESQFVEIKIASTDGAIISTCDVSLLLRTDFPLQLPDPEPFNDILAGDPFPDFQPMVAYDTIAGDVIIPISVIESIDPFDEDACNGYAVTYRWTATDGCGTRTEVSADFNVMPDTSGPIFASLPAQTDTIDPGDAFPPLIDLVVVNRDGSADGIIVDKSIDPYNEDACLGYDVTYRWEAVDSCGDGTTVTMTFYVDSQENPPTFVTPLDSIPDIFEGDSLPAPQILEATDFRGDTVGVVIVHSIDPIVRDTCRAYPVTYRWNATDSCGNSATVTNTFSIIPDTSLLDFVLDGMDDLSIQVSLDCSQSAPISVPIDLSVHQDKTVTVTITDSDWNVMERFIYDEPFDYDFGIGDFHVIYTISDQCMNMVMDTINVVSADLSAPIFICPGAHDIFVSDFGSCTAVASWPIPTAFDNCDEIDVEQISGPEIGAILEVGSYIVEYSATDESNNISICQIEVAVVPIDLISFECDSIHLSLDSNCQALFIPEDIINADELICVPDLSVKVIVESDTLSGDTIDLGPHFGKPIRYIICDPLSNNCCENVVLLTDSIAPIILCKDTVSISCFSDPNLYYPEVRECDQLTWYVSDLEINEICINTEFKKSIKREFIAVDDSGNISQPCVETILIRYANIDSLYENGLIEFPKDTTVSCDGGDWQDYLDHNYGTPIIDGLSGSELELCDIEVDYEDEIFLDHSCLKILKRKWRIIEHICGEDHRKVVGTQVIRIEDNTGPVILIKPDTAKIFTQPHHCYGYFFSPQIELADICQESQKLTYSFQFDNQSFVPSDSIEIPLGRHKIKIVAGDGCNNYTVDSIFVEVIDNVIPVAACLENTIISITNEVVSYSVESLDIGSYDNCELTSVEIRKAYVSCSVEDTIFGNEVKFCCADIGKEVEVILKATDHTGNVNYCSAFVKVQEKIIPKVVCPPDLIIDCAADIRGQAVDSFYYNLFGRVIQDESERLKLGISEEFIIESSAEVIDGIAIDNCDDNLEIEIAIEENLNDCGIGTIKRTFVAVDNGGNRSKPCTQTIEIVRGTDQNDLQISWPKEEVFIEECSIDNSILPEYTGRPDYVDSPCHLLGNNYEDTYLDFSDSQNGVCSKIVRTWTIVDWCNTNALDKPITFTQIIKIADSESPTFDECSTQELLISGTSDNCSNIEVQVYKRAFDNCTENNQIEWKLFIDYYQDGSVDQTMIPTSDSDGVIVKTALPTGYHLLSWEITDQCGNISICEESINVVNEKPPTILASGLSTSLNVNSEVVVWATDLEVKTSHPCESNISLSIARFSQPFSLSNSSLVFNCDDVGANPVDVFASISLGDGRYAYDKVTVVISVENNSSACQNYNINFNDHGEVTGFVFTDEGNMVPDVSFILYDGNNESLMAEAVSDNSGIYDLGNVEKFNQYYILPGLEDNVLNGVSTLDIVHLQRHMLGISEFKSPYKIIAGDVNRDAKVSVRDITDLRRALLGLPSFMGDQNAWRFIDADMIFDDKQYPFYNYLRDLTYFTYENASMDFVAMKVGDLDGSVDLENLKSGSNRSTKVIEAEDLQMSRGTESSITFNLKHGMPIHGFQLGCSIDYSKVEVVDVTTNLKSVELMYNDKTGLLISGSTGKSIPVSTGEELFTITFKALENTRLSEVFNLDENILTSEVYDEHLKPHSTVLNFSKNPQSFKVSQNHPNPFSGRTIIEVEMPVTDQAVFEIHNYSGLKIYSKTIGLNRGLNQLVINSEELKLKGLNYFTITYGEHRVTKKMIVLE